MGIKVNNIADVTEVNGIANIAEINGITVPAGGIALVQSASGTTADGSAGLTVNFGVPVTAGNSVIALISTADDGDFSVNPTTVGGGNELLDAITNIYNAGANFNVNMTALHNVATGVTGITFVMSGAIRASMQILEVSGLADAAAEDTSTNTGSNNVFLFNAVTPTSANNLIVGIGAYANATDDYSSGPISPFARLGTGAGGASVFQEVVWAIQSTATLQDDNMTIILANDHDSANCAAVFGAA